MIKFTNEKVIDVSDWDDLVEKTYKRPYAFQQQYGCQERQIFHLTVPSDESMDDEMNDSIPEEINGNEMGVKFDVWLKRDPKEWNGKKRDERFLDLFWQRNFYPDICTVANDLYKKGLIETGDYVIDLDW